MSGVGAIGAHWRESGDRASQAAYLPEPDVAVTARKLGLSPDALARAMGVAKAREDAERLEPYIRACVREELPDALDELLDGDDDAPNGNRQPRKPAPKAKANGNGASGPKANGNGSNVDPASGHRPPPDTEPSDDESLHWTSKTLW